MAVMMSDYSYVGPIPLATIGAVYYIGMMAASALWLFTKSELLEKLLLPVTAIGVALSAVFVYLQLFVITEICPFCMVSAAATTLLFFIELTVKKIGGARTAPIVNPAIAAPISKPTIGSNRLCPCGCPSSAGRCERQSPSAMSTL